MRQNGFVNRFDGALWYYAPMKILNITAQKPDSTGSGVYLAELVRCQVEAGHEAAVVCGIGANDEVSLPAGVLVHPVRFETAELPFAVCGMSDEMPYPSTRYRDLTPAMVAQFEACFACALREVDEAFQPDVVICHHLYLLTTIAHEVLPHRVMGAVCHSTDLRQMGKHALAHDRMVVAMNNLDIVFSLHEEQAHEIERVYGIDPARIHVVGTGYNRNVFSLGDRQLQSGEREQENRPVELVYVGKIAEKKGVASLVAALDYLGRAPSELILRLVGGAGSADEAERIHDRARASRYPVDFLGKVSQDDLVAAYRRADVFVLPSFYEGLPLVVVEALACGCKVVVTDLPGIRPWLEKHIPDAPVFYVDLPHMVSIDEPDPVQVPAFEQRLARAIEQAIALPSRACETHSVSWEHLTEQIVRFMEQA